MKSPRQTPRKKSGGFSLVEIMVAMVIGLLGTVVIFQVFSVSERQKRTTVSGGDAQQNGAIALFSIEQEARMAGFGLNHPSLLGCSIKWYVEGPPERGTDFGNPAIILTPIVITQGAAGAAGTSGLPDTITITYGSSDLAGIPGTLLATNNGAANYKVSNRYGYNTSDLVVVAEPGKDCTLAGVTDVPGGGQSDNIIHNSGAGQGPISAYNKPGGLGVAYSVGASVINLGPTPTVNTYDIDTANNHLRVQASLSAASAAAVATPIVDGIVQLQARYGRDTSGTADGVIDVWDTTAPTTADGWSRVLAVRIAVVARSSQRENPGQSGAGCTATTALPQWLADPITNVTENIDVSTGNADWRCYRYKTFQTAVSLRNMIWRPL